MPSTPTPVFGLPRPKRQSSKRRVQARQNTRFTVKLVDDPQQAVTGLNISLGGMLCACEAPVWPGNRQVFDITLAEGQTLRVVGRVLELVAHPTRRAPSAVAMRVHFDEVSSESLNVLRTFLQEHDTAR